jgi:hypothetical protein
MDIGFAKDAYFFGWVAHRAKVGRSSGKSWSLIGETRSGGRENKPRRVVHGSVCEETRQRRRGRGLLLVIARRVALA